MTARIDAGSKRCARDGCDVEFIRRRGESVPTFRARELCSWACQRAGSIRPEVAEFVAGDRRCARGGCEEVLVRRAGERPHRFAARSYCNEECRRWRRVPPGEATPSKPCDRPGCAEVIVRPAGVSSATWEARRYCGKDCQNAAQHLPDGVRSRRAVGRAAAARARRAEERRAGLTVFGDAPRAEVWRPGAFRDPELRRGYVRVPREDSRTS